VPKSEARVNEVMEAVRMYTLNSDNDGVFDLDYSTVQNIDRLIDVDTSVLSNGSGYSYAQRYADTRFQGQVKRAFDRLAWDGELRKAGAGTTGPDGRRVSRNDVRYYTPAAWDAAVARYEEAKAIRKEMALAWEKIHSRLLLLGISNSACYQDGAPHLDLDSWDRLVTMAEASR
jgi:hypothetical protein